MARAEDISWEAEEYIVPGRNTWWYVGLFTVGAGLAVLSIFLKWWTFLILIILSIVAILLSTFRPPRQIKYHLDKTSLEEGNIKHRFEDFRAFGILKEGNHFSAVLIPKKTLCIKRQSLLPRRKRRSHCRLARRSSTHGRSQTRSAR